ncbi:MAG: aminoacetone oxidase family FAD-binding enzyme [Clostridia bacterium]|nr:aminoacetone oxidase family FAD-binding enzyme [Clostridia bacterium]
MADSLPARVAVIGGGAAGLMAAIAAAQAGAKVTVLEQNDRVGRKILATGNGRCNLTNMHARASHCHSVHSAGAELAGAVLNSLPPQAVLAVFESLGLLWREEEDGRVYPHSGQASAVLDVLRFAIDRLSVEIRCGQGVRTLTQTPKGFMLSLADGGALLADRVIVAAGGKASPRLGSDGGGYALLAALGHQLTPCYPALVQLRCAYAGLQALKGLRVQAEATLLVDHMSVRTERGEVLFTDYGLSGIAALSLARHVGPALAEGRSVHARLALLPELVESARVSLIRQRRALFFDIAAGQFATGMLPRRIGEALCLAAGIPLQMQFGSLTDTQADALAALLGDWRFVVAGLQPFENAQVTAGGIDAKDFDPATMESLLVPGLYAVGEVLDVDGDCGGLNLHFAWASGLLAGRAAGGEKL